MSLACLDGVSDEELAAVEVVFRDGREGEWGREPAVTKHL